MNEDAMRKAFESSPRYDFEKDAHGYYVHAIVADAFANFRNGWQAAARAAVPEGWKVVPLEPTPEMIEEGEKAHWSKEIDKMSPTPTEFYDECGGPIGYAWVAMLAAAPEVKP